MQHPSKTSSEIGDEVSFLRLRIQELQKLEVAHKLVEEALRESEEYAKGLLAASHIPLIVMDAETGIYLDCNAAAVKIYGYSSREEVLGKTPLDVSAPYQYDGSDSATEARKHILAGCEKGSHRFEWRHQRADGQIWDADVHVMFLRHRGKSLIQFQLQDITERKKAEKALKESEETLRSLINATNEPLLLTDTEGTILMANETMAQRLGKRVPELIGLCQYNLFPPEVAQNRRNQYDKVVCTGAPVHFEDKREGRTYDISAFPVSDEQDKVSKISIFARDITERKRMEETLRESEGKFRGLADKSIVGVYLLQDGIFKYVNEKLAEILGYTIEELLNKMGPRNVVFPEDWPMLEENINRRISGEIESLNYEFSVITKDKQIRNIEVYSSLTTYKGKPSIIGTFLDITERKQAEEALRISRLQLSEALDLAKVVYWEVDPEADTLILNDSFYTFHGTTAEKEGGYRIAMEEFINRFLHHDDIPLFYRFIQKNMANMDPELLADCEHRIVRGDGEIRHVLNRTRVIRDANGRIAHVYGENQDITDRKGLEEERVHREKLEGVVEMAGTICHELNQPIQIISGYVDLLSMGTCNDTQRGEALAIMQGQIQRMGIISKKLMSLKSCAIQDYAGIGKIIDIGRSFEDESE